jgi:hypothetical protein
VCRAAAPRPAVPVPGLRGEDRALVEALCSDACAGRARQFAARRSIALGPARAGTLVALIGAVTAAIFIATGRDLGRALLVVALLGAGTTRLAYPDSLPLALVRWLGLDPALAAGQWVGVALGLLAIGLGLCFVVL